MQLSDFEIAEYATAAGFAPSQVATAVAIALAESGGKTDARNTAGNHPPSTDRGLWQINSYYHPEVTDTQAYLPAANAAAAYRISGEGADFTPWVTYTSGAYHLFMARANIAAASVQKRIRIGRLLRLTDPHMVGVDVAIVQHAIGLRSLATDGVFGPVTLHAVQVWQAAHHLDADGIVGPKTCAALGFTFGAGG